MRLITSRNFWAGLMFAAFGAAFMLGAGNYSMGSAVRMGPAYFPAIVGGMLTLLGLLVVLQAFFASGGSVPRLHVRPLLIVLAGVCLFGALLRPLGLVLASAVLIVVGAFAGRHFRWLEVLVLTVILVAFSVAVFVYGLGLPFQLWPEL
jgi:hypothetical protein